MKTWTVHDFETFLTHAIVATASVQPGNVATDGRI